MADFDVAAIALASPPASTPPATYTPAITVRNNGLHDAIASGWLSFYRKTTGVLVAQFNVASGTIHPGATGSATADGTLDLSAEVVGTQFVVTGYVTTPNDQVPANNQLAPLTITISAEPPPPPPPVEAHASQHEEGGSDTISVDGLTGKLADGQTPEAHAASHAETGSDELNVDGLHGELADGQTPKAHADSHAPGGSDELSGVPALAHASTHAQGGSDPIEATPPLAHASTHEPEGSDPITGTPPGPHAATHSPEGGDEIDVTGLPGLLADAQTPAAHATSHEPGGSDPINIPAAQPHASTHQWNGTDVVNVAGLSGLLNDPQTPLDHGNERHDPDFATAADVNSIAAARVLIHDQETTAHDAATNLEKTAKKGEPLGYCELDSDGNVPEARVWGPMMDVALQAISDHNVDNSAHAQSTSIEHTGAKGAANGYCELDANALVPANRLGNLGATPAAWQPRIVGAGGTASTLLRSDVAPNIGGIIVHAPNAGQFPPDTIQELIGETFTAPLPEWTFIRWHAFGLFTPGDENSQLRIKVFMKNADNSIERILQETYLEVGLCFGASTYEVNGFVLIHSLTGGRYLTGLSQIASSANSTDPQFHDQEVRNTFDITGSIGSDTANVDLIVELTLYTNGTNGAGWNTGAMIEVQPCQQ